MNPKRVLEMLAELAMLRFFPARNSAVLIGLARLVNQMCADESQVRWLVDRMTSGIYAEWPGPQEMRACFCSRFKPKDGLNAYSTVYPDGIPLRESRARIDPPPVRVFLTAPEGEESRFHKDWEANKQRSKIAQVVPDFNPITHEDVNEAVRKVREEKRKPKGKE